MCRIVGSAWRHDWFDEGFMPLREASRERWKRLDKAFRLGVELPPASLYRFVGSSLRRGRQPGVSVARFHGAGWIDAEIAEFRVASRRSQTEPLPGRVR